MAALLRHSHVLCSVAVMAILGCGGSSPTSQPAATPQPEASASVAEKPTATLPGGQGEEVTSGEYYEAALAIEAAAQALDADALANRFDSKTTLQIALRDIEMPQAQHQDIVEKFTPQAGDRSMSAQIISEVSQGATYQLLRVRKKRGRHIALFRFLNADQGLNYHDLYLHKNPQGKIVATDLYVMSTGELLSQTLRRIALPLLTHDNRNLLQKLLKSESDFIKHWPDIQAMQQAIRNSNGKRAIEIYHQLPQTMQEDKTVLLLRIMAASRVRDEPDYADGLDDFQRLFPGEPMIDLMSVDVMFTERKFEKMRASIDNIDKFVEGDPFLDVLRAASYREAGDLKTAEQLALKAAAQPRLGPQGHWELITIALAAEDYVKTRKYLLEVEERFALEFSDLTEVPDYAGFVKSPEYQTWLRRHDELTPDGQP